MKLSKTISLTLLSLTLGCYLHAQDIQSLAVAAYNDVCTGGNPRETSVADIIELYKKAY